MISRYILPFQHRLTDIPVWQFRSLYFALLQFLVFGRGEDLIKMRAGQIDKVVNQWDEFLLKISFYDTQTTTKGLPQTTCIMKAPEGSEICPIKLTDMYYSRMGFEYGSSGHHDHNWLFPSKYCLKFKVLCFWKRLIVSFYLFCDVRDNR